MLGNKVNIYCIPEDCETDVDQKVGAAAGYHKDTDWWHEDGDDDEEDCRNHGRGFYLW